jgi:hypothetical protein
VLGDFVAEIDGTGRIVESTSLLDCFERSAYASLLSHIDCWNELFHTNYLKVLDRWPGAQESGIPLGQLADFRPPHQEWHVVFPTSHGAPAERQPARLR